MGATEFAEGDKGVIKLKALNTKSDPAGDAGCRSQIVAAELIFVTRTQVDEFIGCKRRTHANGGIVVARAVHIGSKGKRLVQQSIRRTDFDVEGQTKRFLNELGFGAEMLDVESEREMSC